MYYKDIELHPGANQSPGTNLALAVPKYCIIHIHRGMFVTVLFKVSLGNATPSQPGLPSCLVDIRFVIFLEHGDDLFLSAHSVDGVIGCNSTVAGVRRESIASPSCLPNVKLFLGVFSETPAKLWQALLLY